MVLGATYLDLSRLTRLAPSPGLGVPLPWSCRRGLALRQLGHHVLLCKSPSLVPKGWSQSGWEGPSGRTPPQSSCKGDLMESRSGKNGKAR